MVVAAVVAAVLVLGAIGWGVTSFGGGAGGSESGQPRIGEKVNVKAGEGRADVTITGSTRMKGRMNQELLLVGVDFVGTQGDAATGNVATCRAGSEDYIARLGGIPPAFQTGKVAKPGQRFTGILSFEVPAGTTCAVRLYALGHETIRVALPLEAAGQNPLALTPDTKRVRVGEPVPVKIATGQQTMAVRKMSWGATPQGSPGLVVEVEVSCTSGSCAALSDWFMAITPTRRVWGEPGENYKEIGDLSPGEKDRATYYFALPKESGTLEFAEGVHHYPEPEHDFAIPLPS